MEKLDGQSMDIVSENIAKLKELFPDVFSEGKIDFEALEATLGEYVERDDERYSFNWNGKAKARRIAQTPSTGTLRPCKEESKDWDTTQNLYIEGDNLEVLKLLQKSYHKQVKMIYIDPPYNTGKDFVYRDNFKDNIKNYLEITGQVDSEGKRLSTNSDTSGRYHSDWLNMMYPRLKLARNLLKDDGVIFISIDDNEVVNLRKLCDEIFGEDNFVGDLIWKKKYTGGKHAKFYSVLHEYILVYSKTDKIQPFEFDRPDNQKEKFSNEDEFMNVRGRYYTRPLKSNLDERKTLIYPIEMPDGSSITTQWLIGKDRFQQELAEKRLEFRQKRNGEWNIYKKYYENDGGGKIKPSSIIDEYPNNEAKIELKKLFNILEGRDNVFYTVKPTNLIKFLMKHSINKDGIVLDFFSGSGTVADSVMQLNAEDGGNRKYIMVQLPEPTDNKEFPTICEIGKERIRRAGEKIKTDNTDKDLSSLDIGFKVLKLDSSNIKTWDPESGNLEQSLFEAVKNIKQDRNSEDLLYEILLKYGLDLTLPVEELQLAGKRVYVIGLGALVICLDEQITLDTVEEIAKLKKQYESDDFMRVVFRDNGFKDAEVKTNAIQILKQSGIDDVKSV